MNIQKSSHKYDGQRKWIEKGAQYKQGQFSQEEENKLKNSICDYIQNNNLGENGLIKLISEKTDNQSRGSWCKIAEALPERSVQSIHNFAKRKWDTNNYRGKWTQEETDKLIELVNSEGQKWKLIAELLQRTATNVKDKWKSIGQQFHNQRTLVWSFNEILTLFKGIQDSVGVKFINIESKDIKSILQDFYNNNTGYSYFNRLSKNNHQKDNQNHADFFMNYIDFDIARKIEFSNINWTQISHQIKSKSVDDCRNFWFNKTFNNFSNYNLNNEFSLEEEEDLIRQIIKQGPECDEEILFDQIKNSKTQSQNHLKYLQLKKQVSSRNFKNTSDILTELKRFYKQQKIFKQNQIKLEQGEEDQENQNKLLLYFRQNYI